MPEHLAGPGDLAVALVALGGVVAYGWAVRVRRGSRRPLRRWLAWTAGILVATAALTGPLAEAADHDFAAHMVGHVLLGMAAPLLLVLAAPMSTALGVLPVGAARRLSKLLRSRPLRVLTDPVVAALLSVGGLWAIYTTGAYPAMSSRPAIHLLVHAHLLLAGWLFTASLVAVDPMPHRRSYPYRSVVLVSALAAHDILAKYLYGHPPDGVAAAHAETGAMIMYYGGDAVDAAMIVLLCLGWYRAAGRTRTGGWADGAFLTGQSVSTRRARTMTS